MSELKVKALELANHVGEKAEEVVKRARAYHDFLNGAAAATASVTEPKAERKQPVDKPKAETKAEPKAEPKAETKKTANKPGAGIPADQKADGGKNSYKDVVNALTKVRDKSGLTEARRIMMEDGGGVTSVQNLKPERYDAVVEACANVLADEGDADDPTASPPRDELGLS